eukprot:m.127958 g.127958  ORF g.127958 m.127958 type:complete len:145 (+) comp13615_c0_seq4:1306-1740(+)
MRLTANPDVVGRLSRKFPKMVLAVTPALTFSKSKPARDILFDMPLERVVLSSCTPQTRPKPREGGMAARVDFSTPACLVEIAMAVGDIKGVEVSAVLDAARAAANTLLNLGVDPLPAPLDQDSSGNASEENGGPRTADDGEGVE